MTRQKVEMEEEEDGEREDFIAPEKSQHQKARTLVALSSD